MGGGIVTLRRVDVSDLAAVEALCDAGAAPELRWLPVADLVIDPAYQREITNASHVRRIAAVFRWANFSPLMVNDRGDGQFAVIDGQHRAHAAALAGHAKVPCLVARMSVALEAGAFAAVNGLVQKVSGVALFRAALAAGEGWAVAVDQFATRHGCVALQYQPSAATRRPGTLVCVALIRGELARDEGRALGRLIRAISASAAGGADVWFWQERFLRPMVQLMHDWPALAIRDLAAWIDTGEPRKLLTDAELLRGRPEYRGTSPGKLRRMVIEAAAQRRFGKAAA